MQANRTFRKDLIRALNNSLLVCDALSLPVWEIASGIKPSLDCKDATILKLQQEAVSLSLLLREIVNSIKPNA